MRHWLIGAVLLAAPNLIPGVIIDRIAIVSGNAIIKDSDIQRELRVTEFLNNTPLDVGPAARHAAADRLLEQSFIQKEIRAGDYPEASFEAGQKQFAALEKKRFKTGAALQLAVARYGIIPADVQTQLQWQLTVLSFVEQRFKPAAYISDEEVGAYFAAHQNELAREHHGPVTQEQMRPEIVDTLSEGKVNKLFFDWLDEQRKATRIEYREASLR